jgi:hypothetical protein
MSKARSHKKGIQTLVKLNKAVADMHRKLSADQLDELYDAGKRVETPPVVRPAITRMVTGNVAHADPVDEISDEEFSSLFREGLARMAGEGAAIIPFPAGDTPSPARKAGGGKSRAEK